ncbi:MAG: FAD-binding protein [Mycobacterium sp.]|nr:FAD-binding protein [Mycobacterium sp.]
MQQQLASHNLVFSPDPVSAHLATIGGNIIENAGAPHALKYGVTDNHVLSVEAVLADATVITLSTTDDGIDRLGCPIPARDGRSTQPVNQKDGLTPPDMLAR